MLLIEIVPFPLFWHRFSHGEHLILGLENLLFPIREKKSTEIHNSSEHDKHQMPASESTAELKYSPYKTDAH